ncbi:molybdopterin oxidoreductase family protein [Mycobacterium ulcerans str. Harvey]|uniref:Molybdopterin oxidoreductase family protein n=1 Tax=Mycobacterium ulcerans str. Harvey TaxID=1299332 RepID=A0ABN0RA89_MYCUL|nr:molybdopterin oxidoreductase family protein [Mycobacterium ulcerans str. Harvey]
MEPDDFADPDAVLAALDAAGFVVSLELRHSPVTERADVVFPVAPTTQKSGAFVNWEGRYREFEPSLRAAPSKPASQITGSSTRWPMRWRVSRDVVGRVGARRARGAGNWMASTPPAPMSLPSVRPNPRRVRPS